MSTNKRIYLLLGPETGDKGDRLKEIRANLRQEFGSDPEIHRFYPFETLNGEIFAALQNNSLFADHRLVILSQAESLQTAQVNELAQYIKDPVASATLVIISADHYLPAKLSKGVPKNQIITFWEMYENRKPDWLRSQFTKAGFSITANAVELLLELVENNTQELRIIAGQLIQFIASEGVETVNEDIVEQYIQHTRQESVFSLFEHITTGTYQRVIDVLHALIRSGDGDSVPLLAGLTWQFRRLISLEELLAQGEAWEDACKKVSVMGKLAAIKRKKDTIIYQSAVTRYPLPQSYSIVARLGEYDIRTREMGAELQPLLLEQLLGIIMVRKGVLPQKYATLSFFTDVKF